MINYIKFLFKDFFAVTHDSGPLPPPRYEKSRVEEILKNMYNDVIPEYKKETWVKIPTIDADERMAAVKFDGDKPKLSMVHPDFIAAIAKVLEEGEKKYSFMNWEALGFSRVIDALKRHTAEIEKGKDVDEESKIPHAAHIAANCMFLFYWLQYGFCGGKQDNRRWKKWNGAKK